MSSNNDELKYVLKTLLSEHGPMKLTNTLNEIYREWYEFFQVVSGQRVEPKPEPEVKERKVSFAETIDVSTQTDAPTENPVVDASVPEPVPSHPPALNVDYALKKMMHVEAILAKRKELMEQGKNPSDALTEENLRQWIGAGDTYYAIAERTGVPDAEVGDACKKLGLRSAASAKISQKYAMRKSQGK